MPQPDPQPAPQRRRPFLRPVEAYDIDDVLDMLDDAPTVPGLKVTVTGADGPHPAVTLIEAERSTRTPVIDLTGDLSRLAQTYETLPAAWLAWLDQRPLCDEHALTEGVMTIGWSDLAPRKVRWQVVAPRSHGVSPPWVPSVSTLKSTPEAVRLGARERATGLPVAALQAGEVTVWIHTENPALSSAVLAQPLDPDQHAVFTPGGPVATGSAAAIRRLIEETNEPHVHMPVQGLAQIGWV